MKETITKHTCDLCGKVDNLGDNHESGEGNLRLKGNIGSNYANGGASWDDKFDLCLDCFKEMRKMIQDFIKVKYNTRK